MNKRILFTLAAAALVAGCGTSGGPGAGGYGADASGATVRSAFGLCWRTAFWSPGAASAECDPDLVAKPKAPAPAPVAAPQPVAPVPAPAPAPIPVTPVAPVKPAPAPVAAAPAKPKRCDMAITLQNDQTFAFNSTTLTPAARARIDKDVLPRLPDCASIDLIMISGHTDRIGSQQYNQRLSEQRANAVKAYLISKGAPAAKIDTMGMGKTVPAKYCPDSRDQKALHECLAPNRRVEIEVKGPGR